MRLSLRYRLLLPITLLLTGDALATAWAAALATEEVEQRLAAQQWAIARTVHSSAFPIKDRVLDQMKGLSGAEAEFIFVPLTGPLESTFHNPKLSPPTEVLISLQSEGDEKRTLGPPVELEGRYFSCLRLQLRRPHPDAGADVYILYPESLRRSAVRDAVRPLVILGGLGGLMAVSLTFAYGSRLVRRIREVEARTSLIAGGDFRPMPLTMPNDELRDLCNSVNEMAHRLMAFQKESQLSERLRLLGQFSGGLAHQLRNASAGARLAIELFLAENTGADPEPLQVALRQLGRIETNLRQFLELGKPLMSVHKTCDLVKLIEQSITLLRPQCQHAGTALQWKAPAGSRLIVGDRAQLSHLFDNVIGNAGEAAGSGGMVEVRILDADVRSQAFASTSGSQLEASSVIIEVVDTGPGPPPEIAARLFEPFVTGKNEGIGLGLAVAKQVADAHGGRIEWSHRDGRTIFRIELRQSSPGL